MNDSVQLIVLKRPEQVLVQRCNVRPAWARIGADFPSEFVRFAVTFERGLFRSVPAAGPQELVKDNSLPIPLKGSS